MKTWCGAWLLFLLCIPGAYAGSIEATANLERHANGAAIHLSWPLSDTINARIGFNSYITQDQLLIASDNTTLGRELAFSVKRKVDNYDVLLDWFPFNNYLRLTAGLVFSNVSTTTLVRPSSHRGNFTGNTITTELVSNTRDRLTSAPYLGFGLGLPHGRSYKRGLSIDLGIVFERPPDVLSGRNYCTISDQQCQQMSESISRQKQQINGYFDQHRYLMARVGVTYRF